MGVRRALGARRRDVAAQFLVESSLLTVAGSVLGSVLGLFGAALIQAFAGWPPAVHPLMIDSPFDLRARRAIALLTPPERRFRPTGEPARRGLYAPGRRLPPASLPWRHGLPERRLPGGRGPATGHESGRGVRGRRGAWLQAVRSDFGGATPPSPCSATRRISGTGGGGLSASGVLSPRWSRMSIASVALATAEASTVS